MTDDQKWARTRGTLVLPYKLLSLRSDSSLNWQDVVLATWKIPPHVARGRGLSRKSTNGYANIATLQSERATLPEVCVYQGNTLSSTADQVAVSKSEIRFLLLLFAKTSKTGSGGRVRKEKRGGGHADGAGERGEEGEDARVPPQLDA